jgi:transposase
VGNRLHKVLEDANVKLGSVATDILGMSRRPMIEALIRGEEDPEKLASLARGRLRSKIPELERALQGRVTTHHRFLLRLLWKDLESLEVLIGELGAKIKELTRPLVPQIEQMMEIPGIQNQGAEVRLAEVGPDVNPPYPPSPRFLVRDVSRQ